jgi:ubiquinone/menaquinone biosynthesis C-methylase UbiE
VGLNRYIAKQFSNPTGLGGKIISHIMNIQNRNLYGETIRLLSPADSDSVLDIGCGNGYMLNMLARRYNCDFTGIDISNIAIKAASNRNRMFVKNGRMTFLCQDVSAMSFPDSSFDKAYTVNTVYFWENLDDTMAEIRRVLKPSGVFINALYTNETLSRFSHTRFGYKHFTTEELKRAGVNAGLTAEAIPILDAAAYCIKHTKADEVR